MKAYYILISFMTSLTILGADQLDKKRIIMGDTPYLITCIKINGDPHLIAIHDELAGEQESSVLLARIGNTCYKGKMYDDAIRISQESLCAKLNAHAIITVIDSYRAQFCLNRGEHHLLKGMAYWIAKYTQKGFMPYFGSNTLKSLCILINKQPSQRVDFTIDLEKILAWEVDDFYNPDLLLERKDM